MAITPPNLLILHTTKPVHAELRKHIEKATESFGLRCLLVEQFDSVHLARPGLDLHDHFAGQYLAGIMACPIDGAVGTAFDVAREAYDHAEAMVQERLRRGIGA